MKKTTFCPLFILHLLFFSIVTAHADTKPDVELLPDVTLTVPENKAHVEYLGLQGEPGTPFSLREIDADILIVELFNMYCPTCHKSAPKVNELYTRMDELKQQGIKLVIIGIGATNTELEVDTFRKQFDIPFPLFPDKDLSIYQALVGEGTPTFIGCKKDEDGNAHIFFRKSGGFKQVSAFLDDVLNRAGLK